MNFAFALGFFKQMEKFPQPSPRFLDRWEINLIKQIHYSHKLLEFSQLLSYFSHQQSPAGIVMLVSARKGRESLQDTLGTTGTCSQSQQQQTAALHSMK